MSQNVPQICPASAEANMKHALKQMQYRFAVIHETLSTSFGKPSLVLQVNWREERKKEGESKKGKEKK